MKVIFKRIAYIMLAVPFLLAALFGFYIIGFSLFPHTAYCFIVKGKSYNVFEKALDIIKPMWRWHESLKEQNAKP